MAKDRAAPFSKKHRRYWLPVTGGMILIGIVNVSIGMCTYTRTGDPEPIRLSIPKPDAAPWSLSAAQIPVEVMRAFAIKYPQTIPRGADQIDGDYVVVFPAGAARVRATFRSDGTFVSDE